MRYKRQCIAQSFANKSSSNFHGLLLGIKVHAIHYTEFWLYSSSAALTHVTHTQSSPTWNHNYLLLCQISHFFTLSLSYFPYKCVSTSSKFSNPLISFLYFFHTLILLIFHFFPRTACRPWSIISHYYLPLHPKPE